MPFSATNSSSSDLFVIQPLNNGVTKVSIITEGRNGSMYFFKYEIGNRHSGDKYTY